MKRKIMILVIWLAIYSLLILAISSISRLAVENYADFSYRIQMIGNELIQIDAAKNAFLYEYRFEDNSLESASVRHEETAKEIIQKVTNEIDYLVTARKIRKDSDLTRLHDSFSRNFSEYAGNLNALIRNVREMGNSYAGLTSQWLNQSDRMYMISASTDNDISRQFLTIRELETHYMQNQSARDLEEILSLAEETVYFEEMEESAEIQEDTYDFIALTERMIAINNRIKAPDNGGLMKQSENSFDNTLKTYNQLESGYADAVIHSKLSYDFSVYILISLIFLVTAMWLIKTSDRLISNPLKSIIQFTDRISQGSMPENNLKIFVKTEMDILSKMLNQLAEGLKEKYGYIRALNENNFSIVPDRIKEQDVIGNELIALKKRIVEKTEEQAKNSEENMRRRYINEGLARFAEILRVNNNDIRLLGDKFIQNTVKYLKAIQGGLFLVNKADNEDPTLGLIAAFAYDRKKYLEKTIALGEGLIGTCAVEKSTINLTEIPEGYISITSGLGDTPPDNLLLIPVIHENELIGVIEIASLNKFKDFEITFANEVAKSLAAALVYTRNNDQNNELLKKSQQQAVEIAEQEEEMRQNMEELKATQEESSRREEEYRSVVEAIYNSMFVVEYDPDGQIINANNNICTFLGMRPDELKGKTHQETFHGSVNPDRNFWKEIREKTCLTKEEKIETEGKKEIIKEHFSAVYNAKGDLKKYMNFITKIS